MASVRSAILEKPSLIMFYLLMPPMPWWNILNNANNPSSTATTTSMLILALECYCNYDSSHGKCSTARHCTVKLTIREVLQGYYPSCAGIKHPRRGFYYLCHARSRNTERECSIVPFSEGYSGPICFCSKGDHCNSPTKLNAVLYNEVRRTGFDSTLTKATATSPLPSTAATSPETPSPSAATAAAQNNFEASRGGVIIRRQKSDNGQTIVRPVASKHHNINSASSPASHVEDKRSQTFIKTPRGKQEDEGRNFVRPKQQIPTIQTSKSFTTFLVDVDDNVLISNHINESQASSSNNISDGNAASFLDAFDVVKLDDQISTTENMRQWPNSITTTTTTTTAETSASNETSSVVSDVVVDRDLLIESNDGRIIMNNKTELIPLIRESESAMTTVVPPTRRSQQILSPNDATSNQQPPSYHSSSSSGGSTTADDNDRQGKQTIGSVSSSVNNTAAAVESGEEPKTKTKKKNLGRPVYQNGSAAAIPFHTTKVNRDSLAKPNPNHYNRDSDEPEMTVVENPTTTNFSVTENETSPLFFVQNETSGSIAVTQPPKFVVDPHNPQADDDDDDEKWDSSSSSSPLADSQHVVTLFSMLSICSMTI